MAQLKKAKLKGADVSAATGRIVDLAKNEKLSICTIGPEANWRLAMEYPPVGSEWKDRDLRVKRTVRVVRYDVERRRVRIHCIETDILSWAKPERFNGKSGGYSKIEPIRGKR